MPKFFLQKSQWLYGLLTLLLALLFIDLALNCYYSDSEIWLLTLSQKVFTPSENMAVYYKWFFHFITFMSTAWTHDNILTYQGARFFYALISLGALVLNSFVFCKVFDNKKLFFPFLIISLTSSLFFNQGFRIRADILALFLHTIFLWLVVVCPFKKWQNPIVFITINGLLILTTPKAAIFLMLHALLGFLYLYRSSSKEQRTLGKSLLLSLFYPVCVFLFVLSTLVFLKPYHSILLAIHSAVDFYLKSFDPHLGGAAFFKTFDLMYLLRFFYNSPIHTFLFLFWFVSYFRSLFTNPKKETLQSYFYLYSALLFIFILFYNQKLPFFLAAFLVPLITFQFGIFIDFINQKYRLLFAPSLLLLIASFFTYKQYLLNSRYNNNHKQLLFVSNLQDYKQQNPSVKVYDIIGLLPKNNTYSLFIGPGDVSRRAQIFSYVTTQKPDTYLYTFKNIFFEPELKQFLEKNYFQWSPGVWLLAQKINFGEATSSTEIVRINDKNYWLVPVKKAARVFDITTKKEISSSCFYVDSHKKVSQKPTNNLAIPVDFLKVTVTEIPLPKFHHNPYDLFRFDTAF